MNREQMNAPFAEEELRTFEGRGGKTMTYIEDETVMDRLDAGYGPGNWQVQVEAVNLQAGDVVKVRLGVRESGEWVWYEDFGYPNREGGETLKEAVSDGIRRCGRFVGIARDLYRKSTYEPGGALAPSAPGRSGAAAPPAPPDVETEELVGDARRAGMVRLGSGITALEPRQGPDGYVIGFRLETANDGNIPQVIVLGEAGDALMVRTGGNPSILRDTRIHVGGRLFNVRRPGKRSYYRLKVTSWEWGDFIYPPRDEEPVEAPSIPLFDDAEQAVLDAAMEKAGSS